MNILVTGGAGYIGSILSEKLSKQGYSVIIIDNLHQGHRLAVPENADFILADICRLEEIDSVFDRYHVDAVIHMAAETVVEYSMTDPKRHFNTNVVGSINVLETMLKHKVDKIIFSSSAAVYGSPQKIPLDEIHSKEPVNAYGESKLMFEHILEWYGRAYGIKYISLRYFNAAGASSHYGEDHRPETHLIPNILKTVLKQNNEVTIFGNDYPTKDGSCIRDYLHVVDIALAHILALQKIDVLNGKTYNLGSEIGYSVIDVIRTVEEVTGVKIKTRNAQRRPGDPAILIANSARARQELGWKPQYSDLNNIIETAWHWIQKYPDGYR